MEGSRTLSLALSVAAFALVVTSCGSGTATEDDNKGGATTKEATTASAPSEEAEVFFPKQRPRDDVGLAGFHGRLILDDEGCLRVTTASEGPGATPVWPADYELHAAGGEVRILDDKSRVAAKVGEDVSIIGAEVGSSPHGLLAVDEKTARELEERCPGDYWIVGPRVTGGTETSSSAVSSTAPGIFFPTRQPPVTTYMMALAPGKLVLDDKGCLRLRHLGSSVVPVWPPGFAADASEGKVRILNAKGRVVARVGDEVELGGGEAPRAEAIPLLDERTKRELRERCPGEYWLAAPDVSVIQQG